MAARYLAALAAALLLVSPNLRAQSQPADPPGRVGRLSAIDGNVQQRTPDDNDWVAANLNYPVTTGFAIAPQEGGRAEIQVGSTALRVGALSELDVTSLTDRETSLTLAQGELNVRVGQLPRGERIEIVTPRGVMEILAAGQYHLDAGTTEDPTHFEVFNGHAQVQRDGGNTELASGQAALINMDQSLTMASAQPDPLDQWAFDRDRGPAPRTRTASAPPPPPQSAAAPYISPEMTGEADLSAYGNWSPNPQYGQVWYPSGVPADWAPYTYGHWAWVSPWGWTWIDDEPWGFAPFHYGRWAYLDGGWGWIPGEVVVAPVYAPALVAFFGGFDVGIGWCPLGPGELFVPGFGASVAFVRNVNITNVNINQFNITRVNNTIVVNNDPHWGGQVSNFTNHRFATVVPAAQFGRGTQPVRNVALHSAAITTAAAHLPISRTPAVTPPRTAGTKGPGNRAAQFNRAGQPPLPQARTATPGQPGTVAGANASNRTIAGHALPTLPPAQGHNRTAGPNAPGRFGTGRTGTGTRLVQPGGAPQGPNAPARSVAGHALPALPPAHGMGPSTNRPGTGAPQGAASNNAGTTGRTGRGPFGTSRPNLPTTSSAAPNLSPGPGGHGRPGLPTARQQTQTFPAPQAHVPQSSTSTGSSAGHRGLTAPTTPSFQHNAMAPNRSFTPPQPPAHNAAPNRSFTPPQPPAHNAAPNRSFTPPQPQAHNVAPTRGFTPPAQPQAPMHNAAPARSFSPPPQPQAHIAAPSRSFAPPSQPQAAPHVAAPTHSVPPAAPAHPALNTATSHRPAPLPQVPPPNNQKRQPQQ